MQDAREVERDDALVARVEEWAWNAIVVLFYLPVANGALLYLWWTGGDYALVVRTLGTHAARDLSLGLASGLALALAGRIVAVRTAFGRRMAAVLGRTLGRPSWAACVVVAAASAVGEELLFRGVIQERLGLAAGVLAFAAAHVPWERDLVPWPAMALVSGLVLGLLYAHTGAVLAPVVAHFVVNLVGLRWLTASASTGSAT